MASALIVLAAGKGTRMQSDLPKVLHKVAHAPMLVHTLRAGQSRDPEVIVVITGHGAELVKETAKAYDETIRIEHQSEQLGTAHAVAQAEAALAGFEGNVFVLYGDTPFIQPHTLERMADMRKSYDLVVLGFTATDPGRYGRLIISGDRLERIVEFKDANEDDLAVCLCNSGVVCADKAVLFDLIRDVGNDNASGEYYLTDIVAIAHKNGLSATAIACDESETMGINSRAELAVAETAFQQRARHEALETGITMPAPESVHFAFDTCIGRDCIIEQNVVFGPGVTIESGAQIRAFSHLEGCHVSQGAVVGPYARLRPGTELAEDVKVGNFVEIKNARVDTGAKVNHLTYIGDATIGEHSNIGAGTVTCNYDGVTKHQTTIGKNVFIGSDTMLVAPVNIGDEAMTGSGSVITSDVEPGALALGRSHQVNKPNLARRLFAKLRAHKKS